MLRKTSITLSVSSMIKSDRNLSRESATMPRADCFVESGSEQGEEEVANEIAVQDVRVQDCANLAHFEASLVSPFWRRNSASENVRVYSCFVREELRSASASISSPL